MTERETLEKRMRQSVFGILAHVDAGKTTLAEAMLYQAGKLKKLGRVDHRDTLLDTHILERERGITIFASQAVLPLEGLCVTLLDTPGHVDFSAETERVLQVLDNAILVISGTDGVQAHTRTLWRLLRRYQIPTFLFVTKMDLARRSREALLQELRQTLDERCVDFSEDAVETRMETMAMCREELLEQYLQTGAIPDTAAAELIAAREIFPCFFGSGLKLQGVDALLHALPSCVLPRVWPQRLGAKVFKISHDPQGVRLTHLKVTGGCLRVRDSVTVDGTEEKVSQLRVYSGEKFEAVEAVQAGGVCAVVGLTRTKNGQGLGIEAASRAPFTEPTMYYRIVLPKDCDPQSFLPKLRLLEEEDPQLHVRWDSHLREIHVGLMGEVQGEILVSLLDERFGVRAALDEGRVLYKETIDNAVEGVGHYEPLRHYAEVHLLLEPLPRGSGMQFAATCDEDQLDRSWQRLILTHLQEKEHLGVLTGSPLTDVKITLAAGRAHLKHTEGGDFRQATYRAVRQGLMQAKSRLLEPYVAFRLTVPPEKIGRAITDIRARAGGFDPPEELGNLTLLRGCAPAATMYGYAAELAAYSGGRGRLLCEPCGYADCHDPQDVLARFAYDPERDLENTPDSVFCAHGAGFSVKWSEVPSRMHLESCLKRPELPAARRSFRLDDAELEAIMRRTFGEPKTRLPYRAPRAEPFSQASLPTPAGRQHLIVDGYNLLFAWDELHALAEQDLEAAREELMNRLCGYGAYTGCAVVLVFDAYRVPGNLGKAFEFHNIHVVYTRENETGDAYIERFVAGIGKNERVRVVTSDALIQLSALRAGVLRMSAGEFGRELARVNDEITACLRTLQRQRIGKIGENLKEQAWNEKS